MWGCFPWALPAIRVPFSRLQAGPADFSRQPHPQAERHLLGQSFSSSLSSFAPSCNPLDLLWSHGTIQRALVLGKVGK